MIVASQKLKTYRKKNNFTIEELCLRSGIEYGTLSDWELGKVEEISRKEIDQLIKVLKCRDTDILKG